MQTRRLAAAVLLAAFAFLILRAYEAGTEGPIPGVPRPAAGRPPEADPVPPAEPPREVPAVRGIVVDGEGNPVAGAEVASAADGQRVPARAVTGADGRFALAADPGDHLVGVRAAGMASVLVGGVRPGTGDLRIVLRPGVRLRGTVREGSGAPCGGARVRASLRFPGVVKDLGGFETRADESGRYAFESLPPVEGAVQATFHEASSEAVPFDLRAGAPDGDVDLRVDAGPSLEGVVRGADGSLLEGIVVTARVPGKSAARSATTGEGGRFVLRRLAPEAHDLEAVDPKALWLNTRPRRAVPPEGGIEIAMEPNPAPPAHAVFRVVDAAGAAVLEVRTLAFRNGEAAPTGYGTLTADASGLFRTGRLRAGRLRIDLRAPSGAGTTGEFPVEAGATADLGTIRLAGAASVRGRILDASGSPAAKARLFADEGGLPEGGAVAADGTFSVRGLPPGTGRLRIHLAGCSVLSAPWTAGPGETADLGDLRLREATGALRGTVRSRSGGSVAGARIRISPWDDFGPGSDVRRIAAGADGRFEAAALAAGRWVVSPEAGSFASSGKSLRVDLAEGEQKEIVVEIE